MHDMRQGQSVPDGRGSRPADWRCAARDVTSFPATIEEVRLSTLAPRALGRQPRMRTMTTRFQGPAASTLAATPDRSSMRLPPYRYPSAAENSTRGAICRAADR